MIPNIYTVVMFPQETKEKYEKTKDGDLIKHNSGNLGIVLKVRKEELKVYWLRSKNFKKGWKQGDIGYINRYFNYWVIK